MKGFSMGYSQHQSFYLRDRWIGKALKGLSVDNTLFFQKNAFEKIGLGKNMVQSLKYWITATKLFEEQKDNNQKYHDITLLGTYIKNQDPSIKYKNTAGLLHHSLTTNDEVSTTWYWFFNVFPETVFTKEDMLEDLKKYVQAREKKVVSDNSLKRDVDCLLSLYTTGGSESDPEEVILSPLYKLGLISEKNGVYSKREMNFERENLALFAYSILNYKDNRNVESIALDDLVHKSYLPGKIFNLKRSSIVEMLTVWSEDTEYPVVFTRTNNLDTVRLPNISAIEFLKYKGENL